MPKDERVSTLENFDADDGVEERFLVNFDAVNGELDELLRMNRVYQGRVDTNLGALPHAFREPFTDDARELDREMKRVIASIGEKMTAIQTAFAARGMKDGMLTASSKSTAAGFAAKMEEYEDMKRVFVVVEKILLGHPKIMMEVIAQSGVSDISESDIERCFGPKAVNTYKDFERGTPDSDVGDRDGLGRMSRNGAGEGLTDNHGSESIIANAASAVTQPMADVIPMKPTEDIPSAAGCTVAISEVCSSDDSSIAALSPFYQCAIHIGSLTFFSWNSAYCYVKARFFGIQELARKIIWAPEPDAVKRFYDWPLNDPAWGEIFFDVVFSLFSIKAQNCSEFRTVLEENGAPARYVWPEHYLDRNTLKQLYAVYLTRFAESYVNKTISNPVPFNFDDYCFASAGIRPDKRKLVLADTMWEGLEGGRDTDIVICANKSQFSADALSAVLRAQTAEQEYGCILIAATNGLLQTPYGSLKRQLESVLDVLSPTLHQPHVPRVYVSSVIPRPSGSSTTKARLKMITGVIGRSCGVRGFECVDMGGVFDTSGAADFERCGSALFEDEGMELLSLKGQHCLIDYLAGVMPFFRIVITKRESIEVSVLPSGGMADTTSGTRGRQSLANNDGVDPSNSSASPMRVDSSHATPNGKILRWQSPQALRTSRRGLDPVSRRMFFYGLEPLESEQRYGLESCLLCLLNRVLGLEQDGIALEPADFESIKRLRLKYDPDCTVIMILCSTLSIRGRILSRIEKLDEMNRVRLSRMKTPVTVTVGEMPVMPKAGALVEEQSAVKSIVSNSAESHSVTAAPDIAPSRRQEGEIGPSRCSLVRANKLIFAGLNLLEPDLLEIEDGNSEELTRRVIVLINHIMELEKDGMRLMPSDIEAIVVQKPVEASEPARFEMFFRARSVRDVLLTKIDSLARINERRKSFGLPLIFMAM